MKVWVPIDLPEGWRVHRVTIINESRMQSANFGGVVADQGPTLDPEPQRERWEYRVVVPPTLSPTVEEAEKMIASLGLEGWEAFARDSVRAYRKINSMLREDNGSAVWQEAKTAANTLVFPGTNDAEEVVKGISQRGSIDGEVIRVGGLQNIVPILLRCEGEELPGCWAKKSVAKGLAHKLFEPVRLFGTGRWNRSDEGKWKLDIFRVESFAPLRDVSLSEALTEIRTIEGGWDANSFSELALMRDGSEPA